MSKINMNVMKNVMNGCYTNGGAYHYSRLPYFMQTAIFYANNDTPTNG